MNYKKEILDRTTEILKYALQDETIDSKTFKVICSLLTNIEQLIIER